MIKYLQVLILLIIISIGSNAQFKIPDGYALSKDITDSDLCLKVDFNRDGIKDYFAIIEKDGNTKLLSYISKGTKKYRLLTHKDPDDFVCCSSMSMNQHILSITTKGMRYFQTYKFRYLNKAGDFQLIGYETESFGNAIHEGAGTQSVNLLTSIYEYSIYHAKDEKSGNTEKRTRKIKLPEKYTLSNFDKAIHFLESLELGH